MQDFLDFYMPKYKSEFVKWLSKKYPRDKTSFKLMELSRLEAIYISIRKKEALCHKNFVL